MGNLQIPENYNMKDLYIDASLVTCIDGSSYDFTGRKTFNTSFYRENIGFGITGIEIEVNPSLQPKVDITFKDLYGNTLFGTQRTNNDSIDTSVLFNWPPPKFIFSFKGYLGRKVTWLLNLKATNVSYVPSDGSYEVKCSFVPNQWGFLSDIPVLYLLACKKLRYAAYGNKKEIVVSSILKDSAGNETKGENCVFSSDGVFSYTRAGKQVQTKTTEETKSFELLRTQMSAIKYNLANAVFSSKIIKLNEPLNGIVNNLPITKFTNLTVSIPDKNYEEELRKFQKNSENIPKINSFLQLNVKRGALGDPSDNKIETPIAGGVTVMSDVNEDDANTAKTLAEKKKSVFDIVDKNLSLIDDEIKRRIYSSTKSQISKLTIGEVFRQISRDSGFILGSILQAGFDGYYNAPDRSSENGKKELIGNCFPLFVNNLGEEVPAMAPISTSKGNAPKGDYKVAEYEMKFVEKFIEAIGEGIAENLLSDDISDASEDKIQNRINNLEALQPNPYSAFYSNIAENILIRSGIIAYVTRSKDPAKPGDYPNFSYSQDDSSGSIIALAQSDMKNLSKGILSQLSYEDKADVKRFCEFFDRLISDTEDDMPLASGGYQDSKIGEWMLDPLGRLYKKFDDVVRGYDEEVPNELLDYKIVIGETQQLKGYISDFYRTTDVTIREESAKKAIEAISGLTGVSLRMIINELTGGKTLASGGTGINTVKTGDTSNTIREDIPAFYNTSLISPMTLTAINVKNNGLHWTIPLAKNDRYYFVLFDNSADALKTKEISVDGATTVEDMEDTGFLGIKRLGMMESTPIGFIPIDTYDNTNKPGKELNAITTINDRIKTGECLNYSKCKVFYTDTTSYLQSPKELVQTKKEKTVDEIPSQGLSYAVYTNVYDVPDDSRNLVFGPFNKNTHTIAIQGTLGGDTRALNQRIAIKTMCKHVLKTFEEIDTERNEIVASVLGKANESREALYKQMHTIFNQWQIIAASVKGKEMCSKYNYVAGENLALILEKEFGMCNNHVERGNGNENLVDKPIEGNTLFVYDYPLAPVNNQAIKVKNSIINIDALYKPNGTTTVLNIIQQICTKNNFVFIPFPGDANSDNINEIYKPYPNPANPIVRNYFHVLFTPTPETRTKLSNDSSAYVTDYMKNSDFQNKAISMRFGSINNQIIKGINVGTDSTKPTAESILNLQRLVDKENTNKKVGIDCSMLPVFEGRSYKASLDIMGNAQVYPMQYFYVENMPMFGGLHQIMKVNHSITPNNMTTKIEGIRMRFAVDGSYGGIPPITLEYLDNLGEVLSPLSKILVTGTVNTYVTQNNIIATTFSPQDMKNYTVSNIKKVLSAKKYQFYEDQLNIIGIRSKLNYTNKFDDNIVIIWKNANKEEQSRIYSITTDPGGSLVKNIESGHYNNDGIAIIAEGQWKNSHMFGKHKDVYPALVQASPISYYRDKWPENGYKFNTSTLKTGEIRGFNIHRSNENATSSSVNNWSEGCQVFANPVDFEQFLSICELFRKPAPVANTYFTYTLLHAKDFDSI